MQVFALIALAACVVSGASADLGACSSSVALLTEAENGDFSPYNLATLALRASNKSSRLGFLPLNEDLTQQYINNVEYRNSVNQGAAAAGIDVRLNLGNQFERYVLDKKYRDTIDSLVQDPETQI